jgi:glycosyltransferase involved in cell wall biosynthesis
MRILLRLSRYDLVYSACQENTFFLSILRNIGIFRKPIISIIHHPIYKGRRSEVIVKGHDKLLCLSESVLIKLEKEFEIDNKKAFTIDWGIDLPFYEKANWDSDVESQNSFIISAGKTERDHDTLAKAFFEIDYPLKIYCSDQSAPSIPSLPPNITVQFNHYGAISYTELLTEYEKSYAVAIPLTDTNALAGLTSLLDAMAMQKAVIMTKNSRINLDVEKEGIGIWVDPGDVRGWQKAVTYLLAHPQEAKQMGNRGYYLCQSKYNLEIFSSNLANIFKSLLPN